MLIEKYTIEEFNYNNLSEHKRKFDFVASSVKNLDEVLKKLVDFQVAIPSWALGTGGTRFGRFPGGGEPRSLEEKIEDIGLLHRLNNCSGAISLHIPWDIPTNANDIKALAAQNGIRFDAMNSNTFQDQPGQKQSYKFGSMQHVDKAVRRQAIQHNIEVIKYGIELGSDSLTVWLSDGSNFPGQLNMRKAFQNTLESLAEVYDELPADWKMFVEYKAFEPNFYSTTVGDWGQSLLYANKLGPKAYTLVDLGHHLPNANIEQIVALLLMEEKLGGFHFNDSKYGDDDLTVGSISPYQLFLIFKELVEGMDARGMNHATDLGWMIDASHNVKDPLEDLLQSVEAIMIAYAQALLVDATALEEAQQTNDVVKAQEILQDAYRTDVRPLIAEARLRGGAALQPLQLFRQLKVRENLIKEEDQKRWQPAYNNMSAQPVIAIFDVGKTNKKLFLFDEHYKIVFERSARFNETVDDDGEPCENLESLRLSVFDSLREVFRNKEFDIKAINFSAYGASFVNVDEDGRPATPLYNYLKPFPEELKRQFYDTYGGEEKFSYQTASPVLGHLNSGMQLYWLKYAKPHLYAKIKYALHLPQYMSYLISGNFYSDITSIGCHTNLWDFNKSDYHEWVYKEGIIEKLAPIVSSEHVVPPAFPGANYFVGIGLHDSSAALIPYLVSFHEPFILISTGTWCISLNPFNDQPLTAEELQCDCLSYLTYHGKPVKASRLFGGNEHEQQVKKIADHFNMSALHYRTIEYSPEVMDGLQHKDLQVEKPTETKDLLKGSLFGQRDLNSFDSYDEAYHQLIADIITQQYASTQLVLKGTQVKRIFVDGGFSKNPIYMNLLSAAFPDLEVFAASMAQATAVGTALSIHNCWNKKTLPNDLIELKFYSAVQ